MPYSTTIKTIFKMESKKFFQNPKNVLSTFLAGPFLIILLLFMFSHLSTSSDSSIEIYTTEPILESVSSGFSNVEFRSNLNEYEERVNAEKNVIAIVDNEEGVNIYYNSSLLSNTQLLIEAKKIASNIIVMRENSEQYTEFIETVNDISIVNLNDNDNYYTAFSSIITLVFFITLMSVNTTIGNMSTDAICGERERGTFDTLTLSGVKPSALAIGKMTFIFLIGFTILTINSITLGFGLCWIFDGAYEFFRIQLNNNFFWFLPFLVLFVSISLLITSLFFAISASFEKVKQAMSYAGIVQIILSLLSYAPNALGKDALKFIPIGNTTIVLEAVLKNEDYWNYVFGSFAVVLMFTLLLYIYSVNILRYGEMKK